MSLTNFVVFAEVESPVIASGRLTLDSILAALIYREIGNLDFAHANVPLDKTCGVYHGSQAFFRRNGPSSEVGFARSLKPQELQSGLWLPEGRIRNPEHALHVDQQRYDWVAKTDSYTVIDAEEVRWFGRGDLKCVETILGRLRAIGKKINQGYGWLSSLQLEEIQDDVSLIFNAQPARPIPADVWPVIAPDIPAAYTALETAHPPYCTGTKTTCVVPETRFWSPT